MNQFAHNTVKILSCLVLIVNCDIHPVPFFSGIQSLFGSMPHEKVVTKKYPISATGTCTISTTEGNIAVQTHNHNYVLLTTKKRAKKAEQLEVVQVKEKVLGDALSFATAVGGENQKIKIAVDYELIVPKNIALTLTTNKGTIAVDGLHGPVVAHIGNGSFKGGEVFGFLTVSVEGKGDIQVQHTHETARLNTNAGNVKVFNAHKNVLANAHSKGKIEVCWTQVPKAGSLQLSTQHGDVQVAFPEKTALVVSGKAKRGTVTCEHPLTLKPITTTLDKRAWALFKQEVEGYTGKSDARICAASMRGNIKLTKNMSK